MVAIYSNDTRAVPELMGLLTEVDDSKREILHAQMQLFNP